jgi:chromosome segregation ATPase
MKKRNFKLVGLASLLVFSSLPFRPAHAVEEVMDTIHTTLNQVNWTIDQILQNTFHVEDIGKYVEMINNQVQQITNQIQMITNQIQQLQRLGDPNYYIDMLQLDELVSEVQSLQNGIGRTVAEFRETADGSAALKQTTEGLYEDLSSIPDKFGETVSVNAQPFRQFGVVQDMYAAYDAEWESLNQSVSRLSRDLERTAHELNSAGSQIEADKIRGKLEVLKTQYDAAMDRLQLSGQRLLIQAEANRNAAARNAEFAKQRRAQESLKETLTMRNSGKALLSGNH